MIENSIRGLKQVLLLALLSFFIAFVFQIQEGLSMAREDMPENKKTSPVCGLPKSEEELRKILTPEQYRIMRENGTELPFQNEYWDNKKPGIYVDAITGEPLFSSADKFESASGWPSFTKPISKEKVAENPDISMGMERTEVRSKSSDSHLGHVFDDGPQPTGQRYCINSASLRFIPAQDLDKEGYGDYSYLFKNENVMEPVSEVAVFGAGCFWGVESAFRKLHGVTNTSVGFMGGNFKNPTYEDVCTDKTGHAEVVWVEYDPARISYKELLDTFWSIHDPTTPNRQGADVGSQYRSVIFYSNPQQEKIARQSKEALEKKNKLKNEVVTEIVPAKEFYKAEEYHQRYYEKQGISPTCRIQ